MGIIYQTCKKTGITYAYDNKAYWDKEKKQSRSIRKLIGKIDPQTGEIIPTRKYIKKNDKEENQSSKAVSKVIRKVKHSYFGASYLLDKIGELTGVERDLKNLFPEEYKKILSIVYFLILEENNSLMRFSHWDANHVHPYGKSIASQRSSELFQMISEDKRLDFFRLQGKRRLENEYWAYDTTSISSYSEVLSQVKKGKNKEHDRLSQINLALLFGEKSGLPFYYRKLPGNITDVKTIKRLLREFDVMGYKKVKVVLDRGFYSKENIDNLFKEDSKFIIGTKLSLKYVREELEKEKENLKLWSNLIHQHGFYGVCKTIEWGYEEKRKHGDTTKNKKRAYLHLYYNHEKASRDQVKMNEYLTSLYNDLKANTLKDYRANDYKKYFTVKSAPKKGKQIIANEEAMLEASKNYGYFALLSNEIKNPEEALDLYRSKDIVEKGFGNLKERLKFRRMDVSSELTLNGKLFVEFIALIYLSYIKQKMKKAKLFDKYTISGLLDELDLIEVFEIPQYGKILGEITEKQKNIYDLLGIEVPSLQNSGI